MDIFEGVNLQTQNQMTLHTSAGCTKGSAAETGTQLSTDCNANDNGNAGCGVQDPSTDSFAAGFANAGGGVWATLWDTTGINIWFWTRSAIPADLNSGAPDPTTWGTPTGSWPASTCNPSTYFTQQQLVFDTTLCGAWAGQSAVWASSGCPQATCSDVVQDPSNYNNAYFGVNYVKVYTS